MLSIQALVSEIWADIKVPLIFFGGTVVGNWLSDILWNQFGLGSSLMGGLLPPVVMASILMYGFYKGLKVRLKYQPEDLPAIKEQSRCLISHGAMFSLVAAMNLWCRGDLAGPLSIERVSALLLSLAPYLQGKFESYVIYSQLQSLYMTTHNILEDILNKGGRRIGQAAVDEVLRTASPMAQGMDPGTRRRFVAQKMRRWAQERMSHGDEVEIRESADDLRILVRPAST